MSIQKALYQLASLLRPQPPAWPSLYEYHLIQRKESRLSRAERDDVCRRVEYYINKGELIRNEDGTVTNKITIA